MPLPDTLQSLTTFAKRVLKPVAFVIIIVLVIIWVWPMIRAAGQAAPQPPLGVGDNLVLTFKPSPQTPDAPAQKEKSLADVQRTLFKDAPVDNSKLELLLNGQPTGLSPTVWDWQENQIHVPLLPRPENYDLWRRTLGNKATVALALRSNPEKFVIPADPRTIVPAVRIPEKYFARTGWSLIAATILAVFSVGFFSYALRDPLDPARAAQGHIPPYSLARVQMAFWLALVTCAFLYLWLILRVRDPLNETAMILIGVSAATGFSARAVEAGRRDPGGQPKDADGGILGFFVDILSDADGVSLHRLQMFIWTLILGLLFVYELSQTMLMPVFSPNLLVMMGISSGTYIAFKAKE